MAERRTRVRDEEGLAGLARLVPRLAIDWIQTDPERRHQRFPASMVFVDISGFTALSERLASFGREGAEEITSILQDVFEQLLEVAYRNDGSLVKFGGDALFLLFRGDGHELRAARSADGMRRRLQQIGAMDSLAGDVRLGMTVGAHTGEFDWFLVGNAHRELVAGGPAASRVVELEESAVNGQVIISQELASALPPASVGDVAGKGVLLHGIPDDAQADVVVQPKVDRDADLLVPMAIRQYVGAGGRAAEHRQAVVAFLAFKGTDDLLREGGPEALAEALDELVGQVSEAADAYGVTLVGSDVAPGGGKLILVGGAPVGHDDDAERVLRAARRIVTTPTRLPLRIGVHAGPLFAGLVGPFYRHTWTVMGDTVNLAARLAYAADVGAVLATDTTLLKTRSRFAAVAVEPFSVKGKAEPVRASHVGEVLGARRLEAAKLPLVGRDAELAVLERELAAADEGGRVVEVAGGAGIGKSRMLWSFRQRHPERPLFWGAATAYEATTPYYLFRYLLRHLLGVEEDAEDPGAQLVRRLGDVDPDLVPWAPLVARVAEVAVASSPEVEALDDRFVSAKLREVVGQLLSALIPDRAIVRLEDVHWVDQASSDLLEHLVREVVPRTRWLVLLTTRTEQMRDLADEVVDLGPLSADAVERLADAAAEQGLVSVAVARAIARRAEGHPLFLQELLTYARDGISDELPDTVEQLIGARIDQLDPGHRDLLRHAALLGAQFDLDLLRSVTGQAIDPTDLDVLEAFVRRRSEDTWEFEHSLYREVAYAALPFRQRRELHETTGRVIETRFMGRTDEVAELLALHYHRARVHERAWKFNRLAAAKARAAHANAEAVQFLEWALDSGTKAKVATDDDRLDIWVEMADVFELLGAFDRADEVLSRARRVAPPARRPALWYRTGIIRERYAKYRQALTWYSRTLKALDGREGELRLKVAQRRAEVRLMQGRPEEVIDDLRILLDEAVELGRPELVANAHYDLVWALPLDEGVDEHAAEARRLFAELGRTRDIARLETIVGMRAWDAGDLGAAARHFQASERRFAQAGDPVGSANARMNAAWPLLAQCRYDEMVELLASTPAIFRAAGFTIGEAQVEGLLGFATAARGELVEGEERVAKARDALLAADLGHLARDLETWLAEIALWRGQLDVALSRCEAILAAADDIEDVELLGVARVKAFCQGFDGMPALEQGAKRARGMGQDLEAALAEAAIAWVIGLYEPARSEELLATARATFERLGVVVDPLRRVLGPDQQ